MSHNRLGPSMTFASIPAALDSSVPGATCTQTLAKCDVEGVEPVMGTPDRALEEVDMDKEVDRRQFLRVSAL